MRPLLTILLAAAPLRADYTYRTVAHLSGVRDAVATTSLIKGNRMATLAKDRTTVIDLDRETITEIDTAKKQYSVITFAQWKAANTKTEASFKVAAKSTGQTKSVGVLNAKEMVLIMTGDDSLEITVDSWLAAVPGYQEVKEFQRKLGGKLGYALAIGMPALSSFPEVGRELSKQEGTPVQVTVKISGPRGPAESTMEQGSFSSGPVEVAKFEVPAGFKKIDPK